jgi:ABC-type polysaccharide/polyol phosphate export permease
LSLIIAINPLTYGVALLRHALYLGDPAATAALPSAATCLVASVAFAIVTVAGASSAAKTRTSGALP